MTFCLDSIIIKPENNAEIKNAIILLHGYGKLEVVLVQNQEVQIQEVLEAVEILLYQEMELMELLILEVAVVPRKVIQVEPAEKVWLS